MTHTHKPGAHADAGANRSARIDRILAELVGGVPEIEAASVVSFDGLPMASALPLGMDEDRVAAMSAALLSLGEKAAEGLGRGELTQVYVEGENGTVFLVSADDEAVLVAVAARGAKVGMMLFEVRRAASALGDVLREEHGWVDVPADASEIREAHDPVAVAAVAESAAPAYEPPAAETVYQPTSYDTATPEDVTAEAAAYAEAAPEAAHYAEAAPEAASYEHAAPETSADSGEAYAQPAVVGAPTPSWPSDVAGSLATNGSAPSGDAPHWS